MSIFLQQIYFGTSQCRLEKNNSLQLNSLCYNLPYYVNNLKKYVPILQWLKFKHEHLWKIVQFDNIFGLLVMCFQPIKIPTRKKT